MTQQAAPRASAEASPLSALRRRWWIALLLCPLGAAAGAAASSVGPTTYTAATQLAVGSAGLNNQPNPNQGNQAQGMADQYARWVNNRAAASDDGVKIKAETLPSSNTLEITAGAGSQAAAVRAANTMAQDLIKSVNDSQPGNDPEAVLKQYLEAATKANQLQTQVDAANTRYQVSVGRRESAARQAALRKAMTDLESQQTLLVIQRDALGEKYRQLITTESSALNLNVVTQAAETHDNRNAKLQRFGLLGFVLGGLASLFLAVRLDRQNQRANKQRAGALPPPRRRQPVPKTQQADEPWAVRPAGNRPPARGAGASPAGNSQSGGRPGGGDAPASRPGPTQPTRPSGSR